MNTAARSVKPPPWDPDAVALDYLVAVQRQAEVGPLDGRWLDVLATELVGALRAAYSPEDVERAVANLEPLLLAWEQYATQKHAPQTLRPIAVAAERRPLEPDDLVAEIGNDLASGARALFTELPQAIGELLSARSRRKPPLPTVTALVPEARRR
jgi:hypothetical protein